MADTSSPIQNHLQVIKDKIFSITYKPDGEKVGIQIHTDEPRLVSSRVYNEFESAYFSPVGLSVISSKLHHPRASIIEYEDVKKTCDGKIISIASRASNAWYKKYIGILLAIMATFIYSIATLVVKLLKDYHPFTVSVWRFQGFILPSIPVILFHTFTDKKPVFGSILPITQKKNLKAIALILLRSVVGCSSSILQIYAVQLMNMADASVIVFSSPVFVTLVAHIFLGEKAGIFSLLCALFTFTGVVVIARPPMLTGQTLDENTLIGSILALASMLTSTLVFVILRYLREVHYSVVTISYGIIGSIQSILLATFLGVFELPADIWEWILAFGLIIFTFGGQTALILSLKFEQAGLVSLISTTDVVFAFLWQLVFLGVVPDMYSLLGALIVIGGVTSITIRKWMINLPEDHPTRQRFAFCLK